MTKKRTKKETKKTKKVIYIDKQYTCKNIFCKKNVIIFGVVLVVLFLFVYSYASITSISHVYEHEPGECHIDSECDVGQICVKTCLNFGPDGNCLEYEGIGKCDPLV